MIFDDESFSCPELTSIPGVLPLWQVSAVPEPSGFVATSLLLGAAGLIRRRQARPSDPAAPEGQPDPSLSLAIIGKGERKARRSDVEGLEV